MTTRLAYEGSSDVGVFATLTNSYCLVGSIGSSQNFFSVLESELSDIIPVIPCSVTGTRIIGRLVAGNRHGLVVPSTISESELQHLRNSLPSEVAVKKVEDKLSALGNVIACNDYVALVHPGLDKETQEIIADTLKVEVYRHTIAGQQLVGTYCALSNQGCLVHPSVTRNEQEELSNLLQVPVRTGTINRGQNTIGAGSFVNDWAAFCGVDTTGTEIGVFDQIFNLQNDNSSNNVMMENVRQSIIDELT